MESKELDELIRQERTNVTNAFLKAAKAAKNEREFQTSATNIIEKFSDLAGAQVSLREEYTLFNGRADAVYNRFIIEYEAPGSLRDKNSFGHNQHSIGQVKQYLTDLVRRERHKAERLAGVVFNGDYFIWVRQRENSWYIDDPVPVRPETTDRFLRTLCSLSTERALIPENLVEDFGENANASRQIVATLYRALTDTKARRVKVLFEQWSLQFSEVCDYDNASKLNVGEHARAYGIKESGVDPFKFFFCLHTYYAFLIKLLAIQIVYFYLMPKVGTDLRAAAAKGSDELRKYLMTVEDGGLFHQLGINNLMEGDFFGWYLDCWDSAVEGACRHVIDKLGSYAADTLDIDPETSRDLLKNLYQNLMPKKLRHNLGEYYTPDWLAERTLGMLDGAPEETLREGGEGGKTTRINVYRGDPRKRLLDPACGSGTFLVMAIKRIKQFAWRNSIGERETLDLILKNVVGFDLNPLAVISARTNYLLALGDLLQQRKGDISIPVYLCDSIHTPSEDVHVAGDAPTLGFKSGRYAFPTAVGTFVIPSAVVDAGSIDVLAHLLEESVRIQLDDAGFATKLKAQLRWKSKTEETDIKLVVDLFVHLKKLDAEKINGIWARIIKNAFAPLFVGRFDLVAGNPPWINWEHLPEQYREAIAPLWQTYDLFRHTGLKARLGSAKDDISVLMFYVSVDRYLTEQGRIAFVITQTVFKTEGGGEGFRRFRLGKSGAPIRVLFMDDWSALKPFEGAANKTAIIVAQRGAETRYPVSVGYWRKRVARTSLPESAPIDVILSSVCRMSSWSGEPIDDVRLDSPWITGRPKSLRPIKRIVGPAHYRARAGVCTWLNGAYWVEQIARRADVTVVANCGDVGKKKQDSAEAAVENESVFTLVRGENLSRWRSSPELSIVLADDQDDPAKAIDEARLKRDRPKTYAYFDRFRNELVGRSGYKKLLPEAPFYAVYNIGPYTFAPFKVAWMRISNDLHAALIEGERAVPDNAVVFVACKSAGEAKYICSLVNSTISRYIVASFSVPGNGTWGSPKILNYIPIPKFDSKNSAHRELVELCDEAIQAVSEDDNDALRDIEKRVGRSAARLWEITSAELDDINASLIDLRGTSD